MAKQIIMRDTMDIILESMAGTQEEKIAYVNNFNICNAGEILYFVLKPELNEV